MDWTIVSPLVDLVCLRMRRGALSLLGSKFDAVYWRGSAAAVGPGPVRGSIVRATD